MCRRTRHPGLLRTAPWQRVIGQLSAAGDLRWLVEGLEAKYGLTNSATLLPETAGGVPGRQLAGPAEPRTGTTDPGTASHHRLPHPDRKRLTRGQTCGPDPT